MNPSKFEDSPTLALTMQEIKGQVAILREIIAALQTGQKATDIFSKAVQSSQMLVQLIKMGEFETLNPLIVNLVRYFESAENGMPVEENHIEILSAIMTELIHLTDLRGNKLEKCLEDPQGNLVQLTDALKRVAHEFEAKGPILEGEKKESAKESIFSPKKTFEEGEQLPETTPILSKETFFDSSMFDLFDIEIETQAKVLNQGLIDLERNQKDQALLESLMRAAHSIKGAARVVSLSPIVRLTHAMEDFFSAAQNQKVEIKVEQIDRLLQSVDLLTRLSKVNLKEINDWLLGQLPLIETLIREIEAYAVKESSEETKKNIKPLTDKESTKLPHPIVSKFMGKEKEKPRKIETMKSFQTSFAKDRVLRITAENLNRLMGLAGESLVESRWLFPFEKNLLHFKNGLRSLESTLDLLRDHLRKEKLDEVSQHCLIDLHHQLNIILNDLSEHLGGLDNFIRRNSSLSDRLYQEVINSRMRPFADGVEAFPRMVRDLAHQLGKRVRLDIQGKATPVDRDILEKLETPLNHLLRNAVDHGIELPAERAAAGKPVEGVIKLEAHHRGGLLAITVSDDGRGIDIEQMRQKIIEKKLASVDVASRLTEAEIMDFLFLPGFSTSVRVTEISGRGVGLNIVQKAVQEVGGVVRSVPTLGKGITFHLQLPLTLSVIRALVVEISGEAYAFSLAHIDQILLADSDRIDNIENHQFIHTDNQNIALFPAWQILNLKEPQTTLKRFPVIILSDEHESYGLVVERLIGEKELVVQEFNSRFGKIPNISAGALMEDGSPVLILDIEDIIRSITLSKERLAKVGIKKENQGTNTKKRILIVDDSITVREVESRLLQNQGYNVETAVNGIDGWNAVRLGHYDLVITDIDMPRMNGIELLKAIKSDPKLQYLPVMIVSYKEEDRIKCMEAKADYYLTKRSYQDAALIDAVNDLIGKISYTDER